jgi:hypothetical protein
MDALSATISNPQHCAPLQRDGLGNTRSKPHSRPSRYDVLQKLLIEPISLECNTREPGVDPPDDATGADGPRLRGMAQLVGESPGKLIKAQARRERQSNYQNEIGAEDSRDASREDAVAIHAGNRPRCVKASAVHRWRRAPLRKQTAEALLQNQAGVVPGPGRRVTNGFRRDEIRA